MTVATLLACLDTMELVEWQAFFALEEEDRQQRGTDTPADVGEQLMTNLDHLRE